MFSRLSELCIEAALKGIINTFEAMAVSKIRQNNCSLIHFGIILRNYHMYTLQRKRKKV